MSEQITEASRKVGCRSRWRGLLLLLCLAAPQSCKRAESQLDMAGTYALSTQTPLVLSMDHVPGTPQPPSPDPTIVLRADHTSAVTNFPALVPVPGTEPPFHRWTSGQLLSTNGQWTVTTQTNSTEWGMSKYISHKLVLHIPGRDAVVGHIGRWAVEVEFQLEFGRPFPHPKAPTLPPGHRPLIYKRVASPPPERAGPVAP